MRVALDASALMMPVEADVRVFDELDRVLGDYEPVVPAAVRAELGRLAASSGEAARAARVGRDLADRCGSVEHPEPESYGDDALVGLATRGEVDAVVTNDAPLRERLLACGVPVIHLRGRNKLQRTLP
ncbi:MAG: PIN domain-containing protein [Halobacteriaceae archaeon]